MYRYFMKYIQKLVHSYVYFLHWHVSSAPHKPMGAEDQLSFPVICWWLALTTDTPQDFFLNLEIRNSLFSFFVVRILL